MKEELKKELEANPDNPFLQGHVEALENAESKERTRIMTTPLTCPCGATTETEIRPEERALTFGRRTEDCVQRVPAEATPDCCPECGREWEREELWEVCA